MKKGTDYESGTSVRIRVTVWSTCMKSGHGGLRDEVLGTSVGYVLVI